VRQKTFVKYEQDAIRHQGMVQVAKYRRKGHTVVDIEEAIYFGIINICRYLYLSKIPKKKCTNNHSRFEEKLGTKITKRKGRARGLSEDCF
jgi:hypothetical protein